tara:strand:+ start:6328 stop:6684 length:357 start_codon:yes stop_codon:yes gene_type:complete
MKEQLFQLPLHNSTRELLQKMGIIFMENDDTYNVRGYNAEQGKWGNYEIALHTTMEFDTDDEEVADFYYIIKFNSKEVARLQATPHLLAVIQLFTLDRISNGEMTKNLLNLDEDFDLP